jgi:hypothetical protein
VTVRSETDRRRAAAAAPVGSGQTANLGLHELASEVFAADRQCLERNVGEGRHGAALAGAEPEGELGLAVDRPEPTHPGRMAADAGR